MQIIPNAYFALWMTLPFLVTLFALNFLLVRPVREYLEGRDAAIHGARHDAEHIAHAADAKLADLNAQIARAREQAAALRAAARQAAIHKESEVVDAARKQAEAALESALAGISAEATAARSSLRDAAVALSNDIAGQVLGRRIDA